jgi:predicted DCC family thiol-disulfide oxidoreductase YuxK
VLIFDGQCVYCQKKVRKLLRCNFNHEDEGHKHRLSLTTTKAIEGQNVLKQFDSFLKGVDSVVLLEKIPSRSAELKMRGKLPDLKNGLGVDKPPEDEDFDVRVSIKWEAVYRTSQHLDRPEITYSMKLLWWLLPHVVADYFYDRKARKRYMYGRDDVCVRLEPDAILGLKERLWKLSK